MPLTDGLFVPRRISLAACVLTALAAFMLPAAGYAGTFTAFARKTCPRTTTKPLTVTRRFDFRTPATSYTLRAEFPKGSAANISVNGVVVFSATEDFKKPAVIDRPVILAAKNE